MTMLTYPNLEIPVWPYVYGSPCGSGKLRSKPEDFIVEENLSFEPSGDGEHVFLQISKAGENTEFIARQLARFSGVRQRDIGYAGLKDRHALTTQWFSVWLPGKAEPDWRSFETDNIQIIQTIRHARKLKRGALSGNRFQITVQDWQGDLEATQARLEAIRDGGIANFYGEQRFGTQGRNVAKALAMFKGARVDRELRSLYLSAARSYLFNQILSIRVRQQTWNKALTGDMFMFGGTQSCFHSELPDSDIVRRLQETIIHPAGVLWGKGKMELSGEAREIEQAVIDSIPEFSQGLVAAGTEKSYRPLRVMVDNLKWVFEPSTLQLSFTLPAGSYATSVLRELIEKNT
jgi:tRNA pseudouridine13 synthase